MTQNTKFGSDLYAKQSVYTMNRHHTTLKDESSLFSSSLSDLFSQKLTLPVNHSPLLHSAVGSNSQNGFVGPCEHFEETQDLTIKNLLPDEEELFSGVIDDAGIIAQANSTGDELDDFDLFNCSGGIELEPGNPGLAGNGNMDFDKYVTNRQWRCNNNTVPAAKSAADFRDSTKLLNGGGSRRSSTVHDIYGLDDSFPSPIANTPLDSCPRRNCYPGLLSSDNRYIGNFQAHSLPEFHSHMPNILPRRTLESVDIVGAVTKDINRDLSVQAGSLNGRGFGYCPGGFQIPLSLPSKSESYEYQLLRSIAFPSPSFMNPSSGHVQNHLKMPVHISPPHPMINSVSPPPHNLHVGSAPVFNVSSPFLWPQEGEPVDDFCCSRRSSSHYPVDSSPYHSTRTGVDVPKTRGLLSAQLMSRMALERNLSMSTPSSSGFPTERLGTRAGFNQFSEKKNFELNIDRISRGEDGRTTLMIKNIPNKYTSKMLLATIDEHHKGQYDFLYLPIDFKNKCNVGYAFINMIDPVHIVPLYQTFNGKKWEKFNSEKVACLAYGRIQGKAALIAHFQNSSLMNEDKRCRPIIFHTDGPNAGNQEPFPMGSNPRSRQGTSRLQIE